MNRPIPKGRVPVSSPKKQVSSPFGDDAVSIVLYGPSGVGKTEFAAHFPKPGFVCDEKELGIKDLVRFKRCEAPETIQVVKDWEGLLSVNANIASGKYDIQTAVYDSLTGLELLCFQYHCREYFENNWSDKGFYSYSKGPKNAAKTDWPAFLDSLVAVMQSGVNVVLIGHSDVKTFENPEGPNYDRYRPSLDKEIWNQTHRWVQSVFFYNYHVDLEKKKGATTNQVKTKAVQSSERRFIYTQWSSAYDAKERYGLPPLIDASGSGKIAYANFVKEFPKA